VFALAAAAGAPSSCSPRLRVMTQDVTAVSSRSESAWRMALPCSIWSRRSRSHCGAVSIIKNNGIRVEGRERRRSGNVGGRSQDVHRERHKSTARCLETAAEDWRELRAEDPRTGESGRLRW